MNGITLVAFNYLLIREYVQYLLENNNIISAVRDKGEYNTLFTLV